MAEEVTKTVQADPAEDAFVSQFMTGTAPAPAEDAKAEPDADDKTDAAEPEVVAESDAKTESKHEEAAPEAEAKEEAQEPTLTPRTARLADRLLASFKYSATRLDKFTDAEFASEAIKRADEMLSRAGFPKRQTDQWDLGEKLTTALEWRSRLLTDDKNKPGTQAPKGRAGNDNNGEGRHSARPQSRPVAGEDATDSPDGDDMAVVLDTLDDEPRKIVEARLKAAQAERERMATQLASATRQIRTVNLADALGTVDDDRPGVADDHQAVISATKDQCERAGLDFDEVAASGGETLVRLVRQAAEELGFTQKARRNEPAKPQSKARSTIPKATGRGGTPAPLSADAKDLAATQALMQARGDPHRAAALYRAGS